MIEENTDKTIKKETKDVSLMVMESLETVNQSSKIISDHPCIDLILKYYPFGIQKVHHCGSFFFVF